MSNLKIKADIIISNGYILTIDEKNTIIKNGAIAIIADKIDFIGTNDEIEQKYYSDNLIDAKGKIVMPGFINSHTHLAMTIFRGVADDVMLSDWLYKYIFPAESKFINPSTARTGVELAMLEMIKSGTTCFNNMYYFEDVTAEVAKKAGMRGIIGEGLIDFPVSNSPTPEAGIEYTKNLLKKYQNDQLINVAVGVHSPYTCSEQLIIEAKKLADDNNALYHIHLAETKWEFDTFNEKYKLTPTQFLDRLGVLDNKTVAAHCVWLTENDIEILAQKKVGIAHNPECNLKISSGIAPIPELLNKNAKVGLGTDGVASNNNLSMIQELHTMALIHKANSKIPTVIPAETAVRIATIGSAKVLGKEKEIGSLEVGKKADIIFIDINSPHTTPLYNPYSVIAYSLYGNEITDVIINGKEIMRNNKILTIDENRIFEDANKIAEIIKKELLK
jgi:5-methylthioadenosine/S-adenosylhomocysteine deaminase